MTLGRTASNAIKIKVTGTTTRAVNCACCGGCGCYSVSIPENLREIFESPSLVTMWGYNPDFIDPLGPSEGYPEGSWFAEWLVFEEDLFIFGSLLYSDSCLSSGFEYFSDNGSGDMFFGKKEGCVEVPAVSGTFTINGSGEFPFYYVAGVGSGVPPPNIIIS